MQNMEQVKPKTKSEANEKINNRDGRALPDQEEHVRARTGREKDMRMLISPQRGRWGDKAFGEVMASHGAVKISRVTGNPARSRSTCATRATGFIKNVLVFPALLPIYLYRITLRPLIGSSCKFYPTCSAYAIQSIRRFGPVRGWFLGFNRILRCNPFNPKSGGYDPVPYKLNGGAKWVV